MLQAPLNLNVECINDVMVISPQGDLEPSAETAFKQVLHSMLESDIRKVILNLSSVDHIHYPLLQKLAEVVPLLKDLDGDLLFVGANPYIKKIFQALALDLYQQSYDSIGEALLSFESQPTTDQELH